MATVHLSYEQQGPRGKLEPVFRNIERAREEGMEFVEM